ncbi:16S rRNA (cytidine(1402)-2'-O)-methyltransferase [bacterium]|nr:16S rRNA (cytidine(1402)-2'-O)-methyltransferase [bacterium]
MGKLSIVATPIGNLEDITLRALRTLKESDVIYAEDTRVITKLLAKYEIEKPLQRLDAALEGKRIEEVIERINTGEKVVYVSDAGTPGISDPGARLVAGAREAGVTIEAIPGPSALTALLSIAGLSSDEFVFVGFLPHKKGRQTAIKEMVSCARPTILYESPHRIVKFLEELAVYDMFARVTIGRELTKMFEEVLVGTPSELGTLLKKGKKERGEFAVIVEPSITVKK